MIVPGVTAALPARQWGMRVIASLAAGAAVLVLASPAMSATRPTVKIHASQYGTVVFDARGFALYAFTRDTTRRSTCSGDCAKAWPPYLVRSGAAASGKLVGTIRRSDGATQVTYAGRPLYHYVGERKPGQILCQDVTEYGGIWLLVGPKGKLVR